MREQLAGAVTCLAVALAATACSESSRSAGEPPADGGNEAGAAGESAGGQGGAVTSPPPIGGHGGYGGAGAGGSEPQSTVRVMTLNLLSFVLAGNADARTEIVADAINQYQPDFVALQEVAQSITEPNRAQVLAQATGYHWSWSVAHDFAVYQEGTGYLSRWPVSWEETIELPHGDIGGTFKRVTIGAGLATPHGELAFYSTHAALDPQEHVKADQALATWQLMVAHDNGAPAFLGGDMNADPETLAMRFLRGEAEYEGHQSDLIDAWTTANPGDPGWTSTSDAPERRIDYIYLRSAGSATVTSCELVLTTPVGDLYASDHLGVMCDFAW